MRMSADTSANVEMSCMTTDARHWELLAHGRTLVKISRWHYAGAVGHAVLTVTLSLIRRRC